MLKSDWVETLGDNKLAYAKKGFVISCIGDDDFEAQKIDIPEDWTEEFGFTPPLLESDDEAKKLAILEGFEFEDVTNPYLITGKH